MASGKRERLRALEFYAGVGGFHYSLVRSQVNAEITGSFDINPTANKVYAHNFPNTAHYNRNICGLTASELDNLDPDVIHMSPPCQPFTRQGLRRDKEDRRTDSFFHLMLTISEMRKTPNYILMENVQGFECSHTRNEFTQTLERVGYSYQEFLLSPVQFGVPNSRLRYYLLAKKKPLYFPLKPASEDANALMDFVRQLPCNTETDKAETCLPRVLSSPPPPLLSSYLEHLSEDEMSQYLVPNHILNKYALALDIVQPSSNHSCCFTRGYGNYAVGTGSVIQHHLSEQDMHRCFRQFQERRKNGEIESAFEVLMPLKLRYFTPREVANLMGFPPEFSIPSDVTLRQSYKVLGNSLNVYVVSVLLKYLLHDPVNPVSA